MMIQLTLQSGEMINIRQSAVLAVYEGYHAGIAEKKVTFVQVGHMTHIVKERAEDILRYFN